ncbi:hypothetical protein CC1G_13582 [Coprinopsis cinerea okayama7|uniref:Uncharacterized protein n=1 Tax=Coprinopsis cinerea (strain Okayama-7 / 130 / ATCC MYA-4618 / FGSC 9003) TaxID=240176 RepID=D6RJS4_COPC7|nr:hypothetical protein CC1G_13582 [Coprinopsis cinerea okayama7\|eukprot:XP_002912054.1 hypothetical protein CC1G_13582 [Coprinopsis cinerea okayama7\
MTIDHPQAYGCGPEARTGTKLERGPGGEERFVFAADPQTLTTLSSFGIRFCQPECTPACLEPQLGLQNDTRRHLSLQCSRHPPHPVPFRLTNPQLNSAQIQVTVHPGSPAEDSTFNLSGSHP